MYEEGEADDERRLELDSVEEARCNALLQSARYLEGVRRYHDRHVQERSFSIGDMVLPYLERRRTPQTQFNMGRTIHCIQSDKTRILSSPIPEWNGSNELLEH